MRFLLIERYLLAKILTSLLISLTIVAVVELLVGFVSISRDLGDVEDITSLGILILTLMQAPSILLVLLPFVFLFGTLSAFVGLNRSSELIAMRAAGISAWRFIMPAAIAAFLIGAAATLAINPAASNLNARYEQARVTLRMGGVSTINQETWLRQGDERQQIVIRARSRNNQRDLVLKIVSVFFYNVDKAGNLEFDRVSAADEARLLNGAWILKNVSTARPGGLSEHSESLTIPSSVRSFSGVQEAATGSISFWTLPLAIRDAERAGLSATNYRLTFQQLVAAPLLYSAMTILAAAFSLRLVRLGGLSALIGASVALGFGFFFFNAVCGSLARAGIVPTVLAAWTPPLITLLFGVTLLCYTEDG